VVVADLAEDTRYDPVHKRNALALGFHGFLAVPLQTAETKIGALMVYTRTIRRFTPDDISLLTALADHASLAIDKDRLLSERARVNETLRQSEKLASLAHLLAGVAHELNNPLAVIVGYSQLLQRTVASPSTAQQLQRIVEATDRCVNIVRNFLALARQEPPARQWVDLTKIVREAADFFVYPFRTDGVKMTLDLDEDVPPIWADPHQLKQVLVNLLSNAHHAVAQTQGQRGVTVRSHVDRPRGRVCLAVSDTGPGIPPEIRSRVFDPFFTTKPVGQGTGLGLSLCHAIVDAHEGSIRVGETSGTGTTMLVEIPIGAAPGDRSEAAAVDPSSIPERKTILVVDDEPALVALLTDTLTRDGHRVETASNGALALERLSAAPYDVILCDVKMPVLDGQELHRRLQRSRPELVSRLVFITGDSLSPDTSAFLERTRLPVLMKPFHVDDVRRVVHRVGQAP
jgi:signal transduction histidine kinase/CheY-like chemotaxis protein